MTRPLGRGLSRVCRWVGAAFLIFLAVELLCNIWIRFLSSDEAFLKYASLAQICRGERPLEYCVNVPFGLYPVPGYEQDNNRINAQGFRGEELTIPKPDDLFLIACLGGSSTYDEGVNDSSKTYPARLQAELRQQGWRVEVVNAGTPGWCSRETLLNYATRVMYLDPDLLILYHGINDLLWRCVWPPEKYRSDYVDPHLIYPEFMVRTLLKDLACIRIPLIALGRAYSPSELWAGSEPEFWGVNVATFVLQHVEGTYPSGIFEHVSLQQIFEANSPLYYQRNLENLVIMADHRGTGVLLASFGLDNISFEQLVGEDKGQFYYGLDQMNDAVRAVAETTPAHFFDFAAVMPDKQEYWADWVHNSEAGAAEKARLFADYVIENRLIPQRFRQPDSEVVVE